MLLNMSLVSDSHLIDSSMNQIPVLAWFYKLSTVYKDISYTVNSFLYLTKITSH